MFSHHTLILLVALFANSLFGEIIETFYGNLSIEEPVLLELIHSPAMQRLKHVHQYGVAYWIKTHPEEYTRFDHSLGVFAILRLKNASLQEQISGLLHDVSHTAFSHVGDWVYKKENQEEDYQSSIHSDYLTRSGIEEILNKHSYLVEEVCPKREGFLMLEQPLPNLCADRIDYNIQGAYFQNFITKEEALKLVDDLYFENGKWILTDTALAVKLSYFSLFMTEDCWGSAKNFLTATWLANAILRGLEKELISWDDFHFGTDEMVWRRLNSSEDLEIKKYMEMTCNPDAHFQLVDAKKADTFISFKNRGIDPWMKKRGQIVRLSSLNPLFNLALQETKQKSIEGWPVEVH